MNPLQDRREFEVEELGSTNGSCACCGTTTKRVWGFVSFRQQAVGAYFVDWTEDTPDHGAKFDLILGKWGESATEDDRYAVAMDFRLIDGTSQFMVVDAVDRVTTGSSLFRTALKRTEVIGTPLASQVFAVVDAVFMSDSVSAVRRWNEL